MTYATRGKSAIFVLFILNLVGCGGGGSDTTPCQSTIPGLCATLGTSSSSSNLGTAQLPALAVSPAATVAPDITVEGVYSGVLTGSKSSDFVSLILENGEYWSLYGINSATNFRIAGILQGTATSSKGQFTSSDIKDFGSIPALAGTASASYDTKTNTVSGTTKIGATNVGFNGGPIAGSPYNYNTAASLATVTGLWATTILTGEGMTLNVAASGTFSAHSTLGCNLSGTIQPRASGKNVFNVSATTGPTPCLLPNQTGTGVALTYQLVSGKQQLLIMMVDSSRNYGSAVFGTR